MDPKKKVDPERSAELSMAGTLGAHISWARTPDRQARTAPARAALEKKWLDMANGDPVRAEHYRHAHYLRMALKSKIARRRAAKQIAEAEEAEAELRKLDGGDAA